MVTAIWSDLGRNVHKLLSKPNPCPHTLMAHYLHAMPAIAWLHNHSFRRRCKSTNFPSLKPRYPQAVCLFVRICAENTSTPMTHFPCAPPPHTISILQSFPFKDTWPQPRSIRCILPPSSCGHINRPQYAFDIHTAISAALPRHRMPHITGQKQENFLNLRGATTLRCPARVSLR